MRRAYYVEAIRHAEADLMARLPDGALMQRAAAGLATVAARILREAGGVYGSRVALLVGIGDNGGDALYAGAMLARRGVRVTAILLDPTRVHAGGLAALRQAGGRVGNVAAFEGIDLIIDGLLGIGGKGGLRGGARDAGGVGSADAGTSGAGIEGADSAGLGVAGAGTSGVGTAGADSAGTATSGVDIARVRGAGAGAGGADVAGADSAGLDIAGAGAGGVASADADADVASVGARGGAAGLAEAAAESGAPILAVDLPSGIDADSGQVSGTTIRAHVTVTFGAYKPGLLIDPAAERAGVVEFVDIGLSALPAEPAVEALQAADVAALLPRPAHETDKYGRGVIGIACGSAEYPGAGVLATGGALHAGCGAVRYSGPREVADYILRRWPEVMIGAALPADTARVQAWVCGSGFPTDDAYASQRTRQVIESGLPAVLDAGALSYLGGKGGKYAIDAALGAQFVLTPHAGEAARLLGAERADVEARRLDSVRRLADTLGATVLLKGTTTLVARPGGSTVRANPTGTSALATAGSGDVLAGLIGGLLAAGLSAFDAASVGAYLHGMAGRLGQGGIGQGGGDGAGSGSAGGEGEGRDGDGSVVLGVSPIAASDLLAALPWAWQNLQS